MVSAPFYPGAPSKIIQPPCHSEEIAAAADEESAFRGEKQKNVTLGYPHWGTVEYRRTGPRRPEGSSGEFALYGFTSANVYFAVASGC